MSGPSVRSQRPGSTGARPSTNSVTVVVESDGWSPQSWGRTSAPRRNPGGERVTAWMVISLVFASGGLALFDLYLLLSNIQ